MQQMRRKKKTALAIPTEHQEAVSFMVELALKDEAIAKLIFHIANEGASSAARGAKLRREGVKAGVPDYFIPRAAHGFHGLFIELKKRKYAVVSSSQLAWIRALRAEGYAAEFAFGAEEALTILCRYLQGTLYERDEERT